MSTKNEDEKASNFVSNLDSLHVEQFSSLNTEHVNENY